MKTRQQETIEQAQYPVCLTMMRALKWFKTSLSVLISLALSLCLSSAVWVPPVSTNLVASLPAGNAVTDPESLLRLALPTDNPSIRELQADLEDISNQLRAKRWGKIDKDISKAAKLLNNRKDEILASVSEAQRNEAEKLIEAICTDLTPLREAVDAEDKEQVSKLRSQVLSLIGDLEASMVEKFPFEVPAEYSNLPQLKGRATVVMETDKGEIKLVVDGYSAPVTAGNFLDLVQRGFYDGLKFTRAEDFYVLQAGDPPGAEEGFIDSQTGKYRAIPLEVLVKGDPNPTYGATLEDLGRSQAVPALPFSAYGAIAMARPGDDANGASSQFFFSLFEPELTPPGKNLLDGRYAVFGYVIDGQDVLRELKAGDTIKSAKVTQGAENLVQLQAA